GRPLKSRLVCVALEADQRIQRFADCRRSRTLHAIPTSPGRAPSSWARLLLDHSSHLDALQTERGNSPSPKLRLRTRRYNAPFPREPRDQRDRPVRAAASEPVCQPASEPARGPELRSSFLSKETSKPERGERDAPGISARKLEPVPHRSYRQVN